MAIADETPQQNIHRTIARELWVADYRLKNPQATGEEIKQAWAEAAKPLVKTVKAALKQLEKKGVSFTQA